MDSAVLPIIMMAAGQSENWSLLKTSPPTVDHINLKWRNQRQVRKNRRRAHAAGKKGAFA